MPGEVQIDRLLKNIDPEINLGEYVFCSVYNLKNINFKDIVVYIKEKEGFTLVMEKK